MYTGVRDLFASVEAVNDGKTQDEIELCWFARLDDPVGTLGDMDGTIFQSQYEIVRWNVDKTVAGRVRVRREQSGSDIEHSQAIKCKQKNTIAIRETEFTITEDAFEAFKSLSEIGFEKRRYYFPVDGTEGTWPDGPHDGKLIFEVDVFHYADGSVVPWVKIDLEVPNEETEVPKFPWKLKEVIKSDSEEKREFIQELYDREFSITNNKIRAFMDVKE